MDTYQKPVQETEQTMSLVGAGGGGWGAGLFSESLDYWALNTILELRERAIVRERAETEKVIFVLIKCTKQSWYFLDTTNEKKQSCEATTHRNTYNVNYIYLKATITW